MRRLPRLLLLPFLALASSLIYFTSSAQEILPNLILI
jgi:hypothetical protein